MFFVRIRRRIIGCAAILAAALALPAEAEIARPGFEPALAAYLDPLLRTNNFSGVILVARGDDIVFERGYGYADVEQAALNGPKTVFQIASVSKPFTAAAIMLLAERGRINLHAPLTRVLPDYPGGERLTIHHLLTHSSGIPNINDLPEYEALQLRPQRPADLVDVFKALPLESEPGTGFSYSNSNYNLLALIIERASGASYGEFLRREILAPLGLDRTGDRSPMSRIVPGIADGYAPEGAVGLQRANYLDWSSKTGNGSLYSDARGILGFVRGVHQGRLLNPASRAASFTQHFPNIGYGWFIARANGREIHHISGRSPGWTAQVDHYVEDDVTVIVLSNVYVSVTTPIARAVGALYFGLPVEPMPPLTPERLAADRIEALVGTYEFGPDYYVPNARIRIFEAGGELSGQYVGLSYPPFSFIPTEGGRFLIRSFWLPAEFTMDRSGRATELKLEDFVGRRTDSN